MQFYKAKSQDAACQLIWPGFENLVKATEQQNCDGEFYFSEKESNGEEAEKNRENKFLPKIFYVSISNGLYGMTFRASLEDLGYISRSASSGMQSAQKGGHGIKKTSFNTHTSSGDSSGSKKTGSGGQKEQSESSGDTPPREIKGHPQVGLEDPDSTNNNNNNGHGLIGSPPSKNQEVKEIYKKPSTPLNEKEKYRKIDEDNSHSSQFGD